MRVREADPNWFVDYSEGQHVRIEMSKISYMRASTKSGERKVEVVIGALLFDLVRVVAARFETVFADFEIQERRTHRASATRSVRVLPEDE